MTGPSIRRAFTRRHYWLMGLLCLLTMLAGSAAWRLPQARQQEVAVRSVHKLGGWAFYNCRYQRDRLVGAGPPGPEWLTASVGPDYFGRVDGVTLAGRRELEGFPNFEFVNDYGFDVRDDHLQFLDGLPDLDWLALSGTKISDRGLERLLKVKKLRRLWLDDTQITDAGLRHVAALTGLEYLWLDGTGVSSSGLNHLRGLVHLKTLSLARTRVDDAGLQCLKEMRQLRVLRLDGSACSLPAVLHLLCKVLGHEEHGALEIAGLIRFRRNGDIVALDLSKVRVHDEDVRLVERMHKLEWLYLQGTQITDDGLRRLRALSALSLLHLANTRITDAGLLQLQDLPALKTLHVEGTDITAEGVNEFLRQAEAHPRVYLHESRSVREAEGT